MNFPMEYPIFQFLYWLFNTAGVGGILVGLVGGGVILGYGLTLRWIVCGAKAPEREGYAFPTPHSDTF